MRLLEPLTRNVPSISVATHGQGTRRVRDLPVDPKKKSASTHHSPLKTSHYIKPRPPMTDVYEYIFFPLSDAKVDTDGQKEKKNGGNQGGDERRTTWPRQPECNPKRTTSRLRPQSISAHSHASSSPSTDVQTPRRAAAGRTPGATPETPSGSSGSGSAPTQAGGAFASW
jgi:hypothetical protein